MTERPSQHDPDILAEVAKELLPGVMGWGNFDADESDEVLRDLTDAMRDAIELDGYKIASRLEDDAHWSPDAALVEILGGVEFRTHRLVRAKVERWVEDDAIVPAFAVGDHVEWEHGWGEKRTGKVVAVRPDAAEYVIHEDGKEYPRSRPDRPLGWVVPFEKVAGLVEGEGA